MREGGLRKIGKGGNEEKTNIRAMIKARERAHDASAGARVANESMACWKWREGEGGGGRGREGERLRGRDEDLVSSATNENFPSTKVPERCQIRVSVRDPAESLGCLLI
jgi:hypothetical protein